MKANERQKYNSVQEYLAGLKHNLKGCDRALIQDALADAEEFFRNYKESNSANNLDLSEAEVMQQAVEEFGETDEVAADYRKIDNYLTPNKLAPQVDNRPWWKKFLMIIADPQAWGAVLYMIISMVTGIFFFTWVVTGFSLSASLLVLIIGIPIAGLYLLSIRGIALVEGRIVEALLGVRMPRRAMFIKSKRGLWNRFVELLSSSVTWKAQVYMILQLALGTAYFVLMVTLFALSLSFIFSPILELVFHLPLEVNGIDEFTYPWLLPFIPIVGALLLLGSLHLAKLIGRFHGWFAKLMLVHK